MKTEPVFTSVNGAGSPEFIRDKKYGKSLSLLQMRRKQLCRQDAIPKDLVARIQKAALERNMSPQIYYMLALRTYLSWYCHTDDVMFQTTVSRRGNAEAKKIGFFLANIQPFRSNVSAEEKCEDALTYLHQIQMQNYRHSTTDQKMFADIFKKQHKLPPMRSYESIWFTYQPYYDYSQTDLKFRGRSVWGGFSATPIYIYIMPTSTYGDFKIEYTYCADYVRTENVEKLHSFMLNFLKQVVEHPDWTIKELIHAAIETGGC